MQKKKRSIRELAERLKEIRNRPISQEQIEEFNEIVSGDKEPERKTTRPLESSL